MSAGPLVEGFGLQGTDNQSAVDSSQEASHTAASANQRQRQQQREATGVPKHAAPHHQSGLPNAHVLCSQISLPGSRYGSLNQDYVVRRSSSRC